MLTQSETQAFLMNCLGFTQEQLQIGYQNKLKFLRMLMHAFGRHQPYQNLYHMSQEVPDRHPPTLADNLIHLFQNEGGLCWTLNMGLFHILEEYNYDVYPMAASMMEPEDRKSHILLVINNLQKEGDMWIADAAFESQEYEPICIDFTQSSSVHELPDVTCRWIKEDGYVVRQHKVDPVIGQRFPKAVNGWEYVYYLKINDYTLDEMYDFTDRICYNNPEHPLHHRVHIQGLAESGGKYVRIRNNKLFIADHTGKMVLKKVLKSDEEIEQTINNYFPLFPINIVRKAIQNWRELRKPISP